MTNISIYYTKQKYYLIIIYITINKDNFYLINTI